MNFEQFNSMMWINFGIQIRVSTLYIIDYTANKKALSAFSNTQSHTAELMVKDSLENT